MNPHFQTSCYFEDGYKEILKRIIEMGVSRETRGTKSKELSPFVFSTQNPLNNVLQNPIRKINKAFAVAEWLWIISGRDDLETISFYNSQIKKYSDDGITLTGAYGPKIRQQLYYVYNILLKDKYSRQAIITTWKSSPQSSKDIPCTLTIQFLVNNFDELDVVVNMRSNDAWLGLPYDFYTFTMLQNYVAFKLKLKVGRYTHVVGSEHLYEEHIEQAFSAFSFPTKVKDLIFTENFSSDDLGILIQVDRCVRNNLKCDEMITSLIEPWKTMAETMRDFAIKKHEKNSIQTLKP